MVKDASRLIGLRFEKVGLVPNLRHPSRSQAPAWERDCNKSSALNQKYEIDMGKEAGASDTSAFPGRSLGTRCEIEKLELGNEVTRWLVDRNIN